MTNLQTRLREIAESLLCRDGVGHYCPNCDRTTFDAAMSLKLLADQLSVEPTGKPNLVAHTLTELMDKISRGDPSLTRGEWDAIVAALRELVQIQCSSEKSGAEPVEILKAPSDKPGYTALHYTGEGRMPNCDLCGQPWKAHPMPEHNCPAVRPASE